METILHLIDGITLGEMVIGTLVCMLLAIALDKDSDDD